MQTSWGFAGVIKVDSYSDCLGLYCQTGLEFDQINRERGEYRLYIGQLSQPHFNPNSTQKLGWHENDFTPPTTHPLHKLNGLIFWAVPDPIQQNFE